MEVFTPNKFYTHMFLHKKILHTNAFAHRFLYSHKLCPIHTFAHFTKTFLPTLFYPQEPLHRDFVYHRSACTRFYTEKPFTHGDLCTEKRLHTAIFTHTNISTRRSLYSEPFSTCFLPAETFTQRNPHTQQFLHTKQF